MPNREQVFRSLLGRASRIGLDTHYPWLVHYLSFGLAFTVSVYCVPSFLQCIFFGQVHRGEFLISMMDRLGLFWTLYQRVVALPKAVL